MSNPLLPFTAGELRAEPARRGEPDPEVARLRAVLEAIVAFELDPTIGRGPYEQIAVHAKWAARDALAATKAPQEAHP